MGHYRKITELTAYEKVDDLVEIMAVDSHNYGRRINIGENTYDTEEEAIERVKEIYRGNGMKAFILPYKEVTYHAK